MSKLDSYDDETFVRKSVYDKGLKQERKFKKRRKNKKCGKVPKGKDKNFIHTIGQVNKYGSNKIRLGENFGLEYSDYEGVYWSIRKPGNKGTKFTIKVSSEKG